jgi:predicted acylesterase/phospholipase RssA
MLDAVKEYIGVSAGAMIAFCIVIGYAIPQLISFSKKFNFNTINDVDVEDMLSFFENYGVDSGTKLKRLLESLLKQKGLSPTLTYRQLREAIPEAPILRIFAADVCRVTPKEFSERLTPDTSVVLSLMASMCVPGYFVPVKDPDTGHLLVDGGVFDNFPLAFLSLDERRSAIGITFSEDHVLRVQKVESLPQYFQQIIACLYLPKTLDVWNKNKDIIIIPCGEYPLWDFETTEETKMTLIQKGYAAALAFLQRTSTKGRHRRFSVS